MTTVFVYGLMALMYLHCCWCLWKACQQRDSLQERLDRSIAEGHFYAEYAENLRLSYESTRRGWKADRYDEICRRLRLRKKERGF